MKIKDFEKKVRDLDGITVVIRARRTANIGNYRESRANHTMDISDYIKNNLSAQLVTFAPLLVALCAPGLILESSSASSARSSPIPCSGSAASDAHGFAPAARRHRPSTI